MESPQANSKRFHPWRGQPRGPGQLPLLALLLLQQLPLIGNPGYFSHDELQWWARADVAAWRELPWIPWTDIAVFQYRPLTFNLWLILAHALAAMPYLMHLVFVALGTANALLLAACAERAGATRRVASCAAVLFVLMPYAAYTHGWTATLADILVLGAGLLALRWLQGMNTSRGLPGSTLLIGAVVVGLIITALLSKESAVVLPALLLAALYRHPRRDIVFAVIATSALVVAIYLALRLGVILGTPHNGGAYAWSLGNVPRRLAEYLLFPFVPPMLEVGPLLAKSPARLAAAALCVTALLVALTSAGWRWPAAWFALVVTSLAPVLILDTSYDHYAYLASAAAVGVTAVAWSRIHSAARVVILVVATIALIHGAAIMLRIREVGGVQQRFHADLLQRLSGREQPLPIAPSNPADCWLLERFLADVPSYRGIPLDGRVHIVGCGGTAGAPAEAMMSSTGRLVDAPPG
ncbi:hypothetical protein [Dokdonella soli]|uniref:Glycosyltransferase RgtA/B/C/D-like domain-containing protein n=1 Tax=Dokdonella soli TaxID=529810 RepID=A0ABN1IED6_9GAMM